MKYRLNPGIGKLVSPVTLILPDGTRKQFESGAEACEESRFEQRYGIKAIRAAENSIEVELEGIKTVNVEGSLFDGA